MREIIVSYDGKYPNLCSGNLSVSIDGNVYQFPDYCLQSGGFVSFDEDWQEHVVEGDWEITDWPANLPIEYRQEVLDAVNDQIPHGCCGGCV